MTQYDYDKAVVCKQGLWYEIENSDISSATLTNIIWSTPDNLGIQFDGDLSAEDQTTLGTLVTSHDGTDPVKENDVILISSDGTNWKVKVDNDGVLTTEEVT